MNSITEIVKSTGFTVPRLVWSLLRRQPIGYVEKVYAANRGLADLGPILPVGTKVVFPLDDIEPAKKSEVVRLWD